MIQQDTFTRVLASVHDAALDDAMWPNAAGLIDTALGTRGNILMVGEASERGVRITFRAYNWRGKPRRDLELDYLQNYHPWDERVPRIRKLSDGKLVQIPDLYTQEEKKTSRTYNEYLPASTGQNGLMVRLVLTRRAHLTVALAEPVARDRWGSVQINMIERLLPHLRQFVRVRRVIAAGEALGASLTSLLDCTRVGVIQLDQRGCILEANDRARGILRHGDGLFDEDGFLRARLPSDNVRLQQLLAKAVPTFGEAAASGSLTVSRPPGLPRLVLHLNPVSTRLTEFALEPVAALALVVDPASRPQIDPRLIATALGLTPSQSQVAVMLAEGMSVQDIATATGRRASTVRQLLKQTYSRLGTTGRADLVRLVLSLANLPASGG